MKITNTTPVVVYSPDGDIESLCTWESFAAANDAETVEFVQATWATDGPVCPVGLFLVSALPVAPSHPTAEWALVGNNTLHYGTPDFPLGVLVRIPDGWKALVNGGAVGGDGLVSAARELMLALAKRVDPNTDASALLRCLYLASTAMDAELERIDNPPPGYPQDQLRVRRVFIHAVRDSLDGWEGFEGCNRPIAPGVVDDPDAVEELLDTYAYPKSKDMEALVALAFEERDRRLNLGHLEDAALLDAWLTAEAPAERTFTQEEFDSRLLELAGAHSLSYWITQHGAIYEAVAEALNNEVIASLQEDAPAVRRRNLGQLVVVVEETGRGYLECNGGIVMDSHAGVIDGEVCFDDNLGLADAISKLCGGF